MFCFYKMQIFFLHTITANKFIGSKNIKSMSIILFFFFLLWPGHVFGSPIYERYKHKVKAWTCEVTGFIYSIFGEGCICILMSVISHTPCHNLIFHHHNIERSYCLLRYIRCQVVSWYMLDVDLNDFKHYFIMVM